MKTAIGGLKHAKPKAVKRAFAHAAAAATAIGAAAACAHAFAAKPLAELERALSSVSDGRIVKVSVPPIGPARRAARAFNAMGDELAKSSARRESFLADVSHEFKTPLSHIQRSATLLQDECLPADERERHVQDVLSNARRLSSMTTSLLELALASSSEEPTGREVFSLDEQLRQVLISFAPAMEAKRIDYGADLESVSLYANKVLLHEVWSNLLSNAVKFTPSGGFIEAKLQLAGNSAIVEIADTGCGMGAEQLGRAFERFYQTSTSVGHAGSGLGLPIAKAIVERHGGSIRLASAPDEGTTCTVVLPLRP